MNEQWSSWKSFPMPTRREHLDAPIGPGLYELRYAITGKMLAFGHAPNVAFALSNRRSMSLWRRLMQRWHSPEADERDIEYRTMATGSLREAQDHAKTMLMRRQSWWSRAVGS
jgi:hypothetical protein